MFRQEDRPRTQNRQYIPLRVEGNSLLLGRLSPLFNRRSNTFAAFSKSIDSQLAKLEEQWDHEPIARDEFIVFLSGPHIPTRPR